MHRLAGNWIGSYTYLEPRVPGAKVVGFRLQLFEGSPWRLIGEVLDDPAGGMDDKGIVSGWSWRQYVWFRKTLPSLHVAHDPKPIPIADYMRAHYGETLDRDPGTHVVSYRGIVAPNAAVISGSWTISHRRIVLPSKRVIVLPSAVGSWHMRRDASMR